MTIKAAVIGAGVMGSNHLRTLKAIGEQKVIIAGVAEPFEANRLRAVNQFGVQGYNHYDELFDKEKPDCVIIATPTVLHYNTAINAMQRGIHVLVEKPIAATVEQASQMIEMAKKENVLLTVGHVERFNPAIRELKRRLLAHELGSIFTIHTKRIGPFPARINDVGVTLDLAPHDLDIIKFVAGSPIQRLYAEPLQRIHREHEDGLHVTLRMTNDILATMEINWLTPTKVRELRALGEHGMFVVNYLTQELYFYENDAYPIDWEPLKAIKGVSEGTMTRLKVMHAEPLRLELEHFIESVEQNTQPEITGEDGLWVLQTINDIFSSMTMQQTIIPTHS